MCNQVNLGKEISSTPEVMPFVGWWSSWISYPYLGERRGSSGRVLDSRPKGRGFEPHRRHCVVSLSKNINPSLVLVQPRKIRPFITERLLMGRKESNQTNKYPYLVSDRLGFREFIGTI